MRESSSFVRADRLRLTAHPTLNDAWLRERILEDPSILGLGDLRLADEGRMRKGRLELLLRDLASGHRFAVLMRAGAAEEADLVRAIVYWTIERGRYPEHAHSAIIIAEELPPGVLSAADTLGAAIPLSAMQVSVLSVGENVALNFRLVLDRLANQDAGAGNGNGHGSATPTEEQWERLVQSELEAASSAGSAVAQLSAHEDSVNGNHCDPVSTELIETLAAPPGRYDNLGMVGEPGPTPMQDDDKDVRRVRSYVPYRARRSAARRIFSFICLLSLLLCLAASAAWVRSYWVRDVHTFSGSGREHVVSSQHGRLEWIDGGNERLVKIPYWLPVGIAAILPIAWLIRRGRGHEA